MRNYKNKNVLLIGPRFYNYENEIINFFKRQGANVFFFDERPKSFYYSTISFFSKYVPNFNRINHLYLKKLKKKISVRRYDLFILIRGEILEKKFILGIMDELMTSESQTIYYNWDSFSHSGKGESLYSLFDRAYTFDQADYECHKKKGLRFLPLFFINCYDNKNISAKKKYDVAMIASFKYERYVKTKQIQDKYGNNYLSLYINPIFYLKNLVFSNSYRKIDNKLITFRKISHSDVNNIYLNAKSVLDLPSSFQSGLSIRTIECIGNRVKLITTNENVKSYDFFDENNIFVCDKRMERLPDDKWMNSQYVDISDEIRKKYSFDSWMYTLIGEE